MGETDGLGKEVAEGFFMMHQEFLALLMTMDARGLVSIKSLCPVLLPELIIK